LLYVFFTLNYSSVKTFACANTFINAFTFFVPLVVIMGCLRSSTLGALARKGLCFSGCQAWKWPFRQAGSFLSIWGLRRNASALPRPFKVRALGIITTASFMVAALIVSWSAWSTVAWLLGLQIVMVLIYVFCGKWAPTQQINLKQQIKSATWLVAFYAGMIGLSYLGSFGGTGCLIHPYDTAVIALFAVLIYYWGLPAKFLHT
jgi:hypothetical protein